MTQKSKRFRETLQDVLKSWGLVLQAPPRRHPRHVLKAFLTLEDGTRILVGELWQDDSEFVYCYSPEFKEREYLHPLPGFQNPDEEYRSMRLWPFFQARIPPLDRQDVAEILEKKGVDKADTLRVLSTVSARSIANPYEFELA